MNIFKSFASAMDRQIERNHMLDPQWRADAHQRVMDHVAEMIVSGRVAKIKTVRKNEEEEAVGYSNENLETGERNSIEWGL